MLKDKVLDTILNNSLFQEKILHHECIQASDVFIYNRGVENIDYPLIVAKRQSSDKVTLVRKSTSLTFEVEASPAYANLAVQVDLTHYKKIVFNGKINSTNGTAGHIFVNPTVPLYQCKTATKYIQLSTTVQDYTIDVSDLTGEYYIGMIGSNRQITMYSLALYI